MGKLFGVLLWLDRVVNVVLGGNSRETLSSRAHRMDVKNQPYWGWTAKAINTLFFWQPDHCRKQWEREQAHPLTGEMLPRDKVLHFFAGVSIAMVVGFVLSPCYGLLMAAGTGLVKELYDRLGPDGGTVDVWDFWVTCFGGGAGAAFLIYV